MEGVISFNRMLKVTVPFITEVEKEHDDYDGKPPQIKLTLDAEGNAIANPGHM
jgi:hypothetical protein